MHRASWITCFLVALASGSAACGTEEAQRPAEDLASTYVVEACACPDSPSGAMGSRTVINGEPSACGCPRKGDIQTDPPDPPPVTSCSADGECPPYLEESTSVSARSCCTPEGKCGSRSSFVFGEACVERGGPVGEPSDACPDEGVAFLDMQGCCLPEGVCGLNVAQIPNFGDVGCLDRARMKQLVNDGSQNRDQLATVFLLNDYVLAQWDDTPIPCTPEEAAE